MEIQKFERDITDFYKKSGDDALDARVSALIAHIQEEWSVGKSQLSLSQIKILASAVIAQETKTLHDELQELLAQKERVERQIERRRDDLQDAKYAVFNAIESQFDDTSEMIRARVHQVKLQSLDLFDMLEEMVESAIIEFTKEITFETLSEGALGSIRIRKVVATILGTAVSMAEATPNQAEEILRGTLRGIRSGLVRSLARFKKQLLFMPEESRSLLIEDENDPLKVDQLFTQIITEASQHGSKSCSEILTRVSKEIHYDMQELVELSKETVEMMRERFTSAMERGSKVLNSKTAQEAKRMGISAWGSAKTALGSAIKSAKEKIDKK